MWNSAGNELALGNGAAVGSDKNQVVLLVLGGGTSGSSVQMYALDFAEL